MRCLLFSAAVIAGVVWGSLVPAMAAPLTTPGTIGRNVQATPVEKVGYWRRQYRRYYRRYGSPAPYAYYPPAYGYYPPPAAYAYPPPAYGYQPPPPAYSYSPPVYGNQAPPPTADGDYPSAEGDYGDYPPAEGGDYGDYPANGS
jgi:hypothetical protein